MATAIPESFTFALQSKLPANSFTVSWKEFRPDNSPLNGVSYVIQGEGAGSERIRLHLRGSPNEFLLNTNTYLVGSSYSETSQVPVAGPAEDDPVLADNAKANLVVNTPLVRNGDQIDYFSGSRESFNSGSLPFLDNQDVRRSHVINRLRSELVRRNYSDKGYDQKFDMKGCLAGDFQSKLRSLSKVSTDLSVLEKGDGKRYYLINQSTITAGLPDNSYELLSTGKNELVQIPLGYFSNLVNSHSVIPLGLMSSYSVNGWSIELTTEGTTNLTAFPGSFSTTYGVIGTTAPAHLNPEYSRTNPTNAPDITINLTNSRRVLSDVRIYAPVVQILDPAVMDSILSLYEKREMVNLGGVQFPLSLRMNSLAYRLSAFPIRTGQSDYHFRIAGTDRSVRGVAWWITENNLLNQGIMTMDNPLRLTRLQTKIGNEHIHEIVEDTSVLTDNITNFLNVNARVSGALWSPLPQYMEGRRFTGQSEDGLSRLNNKFARSDFPVWQNIIGVNQSATKGSVCYGVISFENLDRREGDHAGSYQASGKDLTNVGSIEIEMRFNDTAVNTIATFNQLTPSIQEKATSFVTVPPSQDYEINFAYVYDSVMEISPSGVLDITNAVM